ncbi:hypothetical protein LTR53_004960 [Teratosphaeriaceae sp. CCFEE 6253]|nr:hypothetical protein LTR53_004960 [Teratosphaeriaceae sp. CCFEE 6253]
MAAPAPTPSQPLDSSPPSTPPSPQAPSLLALHNPAHSRLSLPFPLRLPLALLLSTTCGSLLGLTHGATEAGLRFRAENAHRTPSTQTGWYLYHKSKNYHMALGGIYEGFRMARRLGLWVGCFVVMEEGIDRGRAGVARWIYGLRGVKEEGRLVEGSRDLVSTMFAGLGTAGAFSAWNRFPAATAVRTVKMGAKVGLVFGGLQDVVSVLRGRRLGYVEFVKLNLLGMAAEREVAIGAVAG